MRTIEYGTTTHVPAFLTKLWKLVTDVACDELISWSLGGTSFIIYDEIRFSKELLPMYFKHNNMASFVRQLNMYGFRKLSCIDQGGMHCYKNEIEFYHQYFIKGQESLLELIKRKIPNSKTEEPKVKQEYIDELLSNLQALKGKQDSTEQNMEILMRENKMLWRHVTALADRYTQQQTVIQQLLPFFVNIVRSRRELSLKRKPSLMIDEGETHNKVARLSPQYFVHEDQDSNQGTPMSPGNVSNRGPVIHDVTEMENSKMYPGTILCPSNSTTTKECEAIVDSPLSNSLESSEQTIDSQFTEAASMERINILNRNFERRSRSNSYSPPMEMKHSPPSTSNSSMRRSSPPSISSYASTSTSSSSLSPTIIIDEATSDVPLPDNIMRYPLAPKIEEVVCSDSCLYTMNPMMSDNKVPPIIDEETMSILAESTAPLLNGGPSMSNGNKYTPSPSFAPHLQNIKSDMSEISWMMNQPAPSYVEPNSIENWLGQFIKPDNSTPSCNMPQPQPSCNMPQTQPSCNMPQPQPSCSMPRPQGSSVGSAGYV